MRHERPSRAAEICTSGATSGAVNLTALETRFCRTWAIWPRSPRTVGKGSWVTRGVRELLEVGVGALELPRADLEVAAVRVELGVGRHQAPDEQRDRRQRPGGQGEDDPRRPALQARDARVELALGGGHDDLER